MNTHVTPIHFFSYETKVSLELPAGWSELQELVGAAIYGYDDADSQSSPRFVVKTIALPTSTAGADQSILAGIIQAARPIQMLNEPITVDIDGFSGQMAIFTFQPSGLSTVMLQHQVVVQVDQIVFSLAGVVEASAQAIWLPVFEAIGQSVRFIPA